MSTTDRRRRRWIRRLVILAALVTGIAAFRAWMFSVNERKYRETLHPPNRRELDDERR